MNEFDFKKQLIMSTGTAIGDDVERLLLDQIPGALRVTKANQRDDRSGTDYWIEHERGTPVSVDTKIRAEDPIEKRGRDDLALETWSVIGSKIGWTLDQSKRTDYILWWFKPTKRWVLIPFLQLQAAFRKRQAEWTSVYRTFKQRTVGTRSDWYSECVFVPRSEVWSAIYEDFGGSKAPANDNVFVNQNKDADPSNVCSVCEKTAVILITGIVERKIYGLKPSAQQREVTVCSRCWKSLGFTYVANDEARR